MIAVGLQWLTEGSRDKPGGQGQQSFQYMMRWTPLWQYMTQYGAVLTFGNYSLSRSLSCTMNIAMSALSLCSYPALTSIKAPLVHNEHSESASSY